MKLATLWLVMCVMGWGQAFTSPTGPLMNVDCSKGQPICPQGHSCQCAPIHTLTEKDWQTLMDMHKAALGALKALQERCDAQQQEIDAIVKVLEPVAIGTQYGSLATDCRVPPDDPKKPCDKNQPSRKALEHKEK